MFPLWLTHGTARSAAAAALVFLSIRSGPPPAQGTFSPPEVPAALSSSFDLTDAELARRVESDPSSLGSLSIGTPSSGILLNPVALTSGPGWDIVYPEAAWATAETVAFVEAAVAKVREIFPDTGPLFIGDVSLPGGGRLKRHETHHLGRDVDFGFYYLGGKGAWFAPGTAANLDLARNWAFVRALLLWTDVETILLDHRLQRLLYDHALKLGEDRDWLDRIFEFRGRSRNPLVRHYVGHRTHYHVRFYNRQAQELGRRAYPFLVQFQKIKPPVFTVPHVVRAGETLGHLAGRYGTSVRAIQAANGLGSTLIRAGRTLRIPFKGAAAPPAKPLSFPLRPLPPRTPAALASADWPTPLGLYGEELAKLARSPYLLGVGFRPPGT